MTQAEGLSEIEVRARRARGQGNDAPLRSSRPYRQILRENVFTFMNNVLFALGLALILLGRTGDALVSIGVVLANTLVGVVQEVRAKRVLDRVALLTRPKATVVREGRERTVDPSDVVMGDLLRVGPGDQIVVDGQVRGPQGARIEVDESLLTGESGLIPKLAGDPVYSGSFCVTGSCLYEAQRVGAESLAHQLTTGARAFRRVLTPLQQQINLVIRVILLLVVYFELLLVVDAALKATALVETVRMTVVVAGLVPNGLFLAIAIAYALGAVRMVGEGVLVQQANAVESLSNVDVLCLDKTGTLTANHLKLHLVRPVGAGAEVLQHDLGDYVASIPARNRTSDAIAEAYAGQTQPVRRAVPFSSSRKWSALAFADLQRPGIYVLGAPEILAPHLAPNPLGANWHALVEEWSAQGLRVLLFAHSDGEVLGEEGDGEPELPPSLRLLAVLSLSDELRPQARETLAHFAEAGIALKIISGDSPETVAALARRAGLGPESRLVAGSELAGLDEEQLVRLAERATIFGRITPQQKESLVRALQRRGHYVAMIGDGVNDVLSLKRANLGLAMQSGSQATRGVADIVLLEDSFAALPHAFREGQRILNGMQDILKLFMTRVLYAAILIVSAGIVGGFPFAPKHNSLLTLFTVGLPTVALAAWARPAPLPRRGLLRSLLRFVLPAAFTLGLAGLGIYLAYYIPAYRAALHSQEAALVVAQSALTTFSVFCGLLLIPFAEPPSRLWTGGDVLIGDRRPGWLALGLLAAYGLVLALDPVRRFFDLATLTWMDYYLLAGAALAWALAQRTIWRRELLERFLGLSAADAAAQISPPRTRAAASPPRPASTGQRKADPPSGGRAGEAE